MGTFEIQIDTPAGRSMFLLVAAPNAAEARLLARDMMLEFAAHGANQVSIREAFDGAKVYAVIARRVPEAV